MKASSARTLVRPVLLAGATLALAACNTVSLPSADQASTAASPGNVPIVDASIRADGLAMPAATAASAASPATAPAVAAPAATPAGLYLQAGTFSSQAGADTAATRIRSKVAELAPMVTVAPRGDKFRVLIGPFKTDKDRQGAAGNIRSKAAGEVANAAP